jgi:hypothetical protein
MTFLEIGVNEGGSLEMWQRYFGPLARIVGIDINPECRKLNGTPGMHVRIGDQSDTKFLQEIVDEFGVPDIVLDDGSHKMSDVFNSFSYLYPKLLKNGVYMVEDMHACYYPKYEGSQDDPSTFINRSKRYVDQLNAHPAYGTGVKRDPLLQGTFGINFYDGAIVYEKGELYRNQYLTMSKK